MPFHTATYFNREGYDTPLWNGSEKEPAPYMGNICFVNGSNYDCYDRNDVNYIAQGMWSAASSEGRIGAWASANAWKIKKYFHLGSADVNYWAQQGVTIYNSYNNP